VRRLGNACATEQRQRWALRDSLRPTRERGQRRALRALPEMVTDAEFENDVALALHRVLEGRDSKERSTSPKNMRVRG